jgi:hypothetical protein
MPLIVHEENAIYKSEREKRGFKAQTFTPSFFRGGEPSASADSRFFSLTPFPEFRGKVLAFYKLIGI